MDGFAVHASDLAELPATLPVAGDIPAGDAGGHAVAPGTAWRIMTGAPMPSGADTVVKVEMTDHAPHVTEPPGRVTIRRAPAPGANVRHAGEDVEPGAPVLPAGGVLRAPAEPRGRGADGSRAGRRPRVHQAARPTRQATWRPEHPRGHKQTEQCWAL